MQHNPVKEALELAVGYITDAMAEAQAEYELNAPYPLRAKQFKARLESINADLEKVQRALTQPAIPEEKCPDCGADMTMECSGLTRMSGTGGCRKDDYAGVVPEGMVLVPIEPTSDMLLAGLIGFTQEVCVAVKRCKENQSDYTPDEQREVDAFRMGMQMHNSLEIKAAWKAMLKAASDQRMKEE